METKRRKYIKEFKLSVVYELLGGMKPKEVFEKYQLDRQTGYRKCLKNTNWTDKQVTDGYRNSKPTEKKPLSEKNLYPEMN